MWNKRFTVTFLLRISLTVPTMMKLLLILILGVSAVFQVSGTSLKDAVGMPEAAELDAVENDVTFSLTDTLKKIILQFLDTVLKHKKGLSDAFKTIFTQILDVLIDQHGKLSSKIKYILERIKEEVKLSPTLRKLLNTVLGLTPNKTKRSLETDKLPREIEEALIRKLTSVTSIRKLRSYIEKLALETKNEVIRVVNEVVKHLSDRELRLAIRDILSGRKRIGSMIVRRQTGISDLWEKIKDLVQKFGGKVVEKFKPFFEWVLQRWSDIKSKINKHVSLVKAIAEELIGSSKQVSKIVAEEALKILADYKKSLGPLYKIVRDKLLGIVDATTTVPTIMF